MVTDVDKLNDAPSGLTAERRRVTPLLRGFPVRPTDSGVIGRQERDNLHDL